MHKVIILTLLFVASSIFGQNKNYVLISIGSRQVQAFKPNEEYIPKIKAAMIQFEKDLTQKYGCKFDDFYREILYVPEKGNPNITIRLLPKGLDTQENWNKLKYNSDGDYKGYEIFYEIKTKKMSNPAYRYLLPWGM